MVCSERPGVEAEELELETDESEVREGDSANPRPVG